MRVFLFLTLFLCASCEALRQPLFDENGNPVIVTDDPVTIPIGDQGDTITVQPGSSEPRPGTLGDAVGDVGGAVVAGITGQPWLAPVLAGAVGYFLRRKKPVVA